MSNFDPANDDLQYIEFTMCGVILHEYFFAGSSSSTTGISMNGLSGWI